VGPDASLVPAFLFFAQRIFKELRLAQLSEPNPRVQKLGELESGRLVAGEKLLPLHVQARIQGFSGASHVRRIEAQGHREILEQFPRRVLELAWA
jgi:hypothetical protein